MAVADQELTEEQIIEAIYEFAIEQMKNGASPAQIREMLIEKGLEPEAAAIVVSNLASARTQAIQGAGKKDMLFGALWCVGGIVVTVGTMSTASGGGTYVVAWGAILFGGIQFVRGLIQSLQG
tara:strand:- start:472 stop:840 length:369 start_codon:yes stop_codon:yes gene_type:complete